MNNDNQRSRDRVYAEGEGPIAPFEFNERVADVFPDMIRRSVPGYGTVLEMIGVLARRYVQPDTTCYDLGCSLGAATLAMRHNIVQPDVTIVGIDSSAAMVERCRLAIARDTSSVPVQIVEGDAREIPLEPASFVVMSYTLQFLPRPDRAHLVARVHDALLAGGAFVLSEKIELADAQRDRLMSELHHDFKRANGYSDLEVARKRAALENVLVRDTVEAHQQRLHNAGFGTVVPWFQCFNFVSLLAVR